MSDGDLQEPRPPGRPPDPIGTHKRDEPGELPAELEDHRDEGAAGPEPTAPESAGAPSGAPRVPRETQHTPRFQFLLGALLAFGAVAIVAAVLLLTGHDESGSAQLANWSRWHPNGDQPLKQIAEHVSHEYRLPGNQQLVLVTSGPVQFAGVKAQVALRNPPSRGGDIDVLNGDGVLYRLCGLGRNCSINEGKPSEQRLFLLRREALELALYTFRYIDDVQQVVVLLPPSPSQPKQRVGFTLLFQRDALAPQLLRPVRATLAARTPSVRNVEQASDASNVERLANPLYVPSLTQGNADLTLYLVLKPYEPTSSGSGR